MTETSQTLGQKEARLKCANCGRRLEFGKDGVCDNGHELCWECMRDNNHKCPICFSGPAATPSTSASTLGQDSCRGCVHLTPTLSGSLWCRWFDAAIIDWKRLQHCLVQNAREQYSPNSPTLGKEGVEQPPAAALPPDGHSKDAMRDMLEDVVNELDLSAAAIEEHGPLGTPPAELVRLVLVEKDNAIRNLRAGMVDAARQEAQTVEEGE